MPNTLTLSDIARIGQARANEAPQEPKVKHRADVIIEIAQDSAPDLVLRRICGRSRQLLVFMPTQNMFCVMNESTKATKPLDKRNITQFMVDGAKGYLPLPDWAGGHLSLTSPMRDKLIGILNDPDTSKCLCRRLVNYRTLTDTKFHQFDSLVRGLGRATGDDYLVHEIIELADMSKGAFQYLNDTLIANNVMAPDMVIEPTRELLNRILDINAVLGVDNTRVIIDKLAERLYELNLTHLTTSRGGSNTACQFLDALSNLLKICERTDAVEVRGYSNQCIQATNAHWLDDPTRVTFAPSRLIEYLFDDARAQGFDNMSTFMDVYIDTLNMQVYMGGHIYDKYPENLLSYHQVLSSQFNRIRENQFAEAWANYAEMAKPFETTCGDYTYVIPTSAADLAHEAMLMSNCVRSYEKQILTGRSAIVFMRKANNPEQSLVTLELKRMDTDAPMSEPFDPREYQVVQAYQSKNRPLDAAQRKALSEYLDKLCAVPTLERIA